MRSYQASVSQGEDTSTKQSPTTYHPNTTLTQIYNQSLLIQLKQYETSTINITQPVQEFRNTLQIEAANLLNNSIQGSSQDRYKTSWIKWITFISAYSGIQQETLTPQHLYPGKNSDPPLVLLLIMFISYAWNTLHLSADNISQMMSHIRYYFKLRMLDTDSFDHESVQACKQAVKLQYATTTENPHPRRKIPFTVSMVKAFIKRWSRSNNPHERVLAAAAPLAFCCLLRGSEYLQTPKRGNQHRIHAIRACDIQFQRKLSNSAIEYIDASQIHEKKLTWEQVRLVRITLQSAKNDPYRAGRTMWFKARQENQHGWDLAEILFHWAESIKLQPENQFFSYPTIKKKKIVLLPLTYDYMRKAIRTFVIEIGLSPQLYGVHSFRVGGACTLRAGGASDSFIQFMGRWRSLPSSYTYHELNGAQFDQALSILNDPTLFTSEDVELLHLRAAPGNALFKNRIAPTGDSDSDDSD